MPLRILLVLVPLLLACDGGLAPPPLVEPGIGGTVTFAQNTWPPRDSLVNLWIVASQVYPLDSAKVFAGIIANPPTIYIYPALDRSLPLYVDSLQYTFPLPPATYRYIAVLQRHRDELSIRSLRVVGLYTAGGNSSQPNVVTVRPFEFVGSINIHVDFHNPPPQPF